MNDFQKVLKGGSIVIFDGGFGTMLQARGLVPGQSPELFGLDRPEVIASVHRDYVAAGAMVVTTNTFGGSAPKLGGGAAVGPFNEKMAVLAREAAAGRAWVAGSVGPTGLMPEPMGKAGFLELVAYFKEQIRGLVAGGVDFILGETHYDLAEARAVVLACREVCDLPVGISMTFEDGASLTGTDPLTFVDTMQNLSADLVATNCSAGPEQLAGVVKSMGARLRTPLLVQPNAGLPELVDGQTVFRLGPDDFAAQMAPFVELGAGCLGGCCGTTPEHIRRLKEKVGSLRVKPRNTEDRPGVVLTSRTMSVPLGWSYPSVLIGERINPTGKKQLSEELQAGELNEALRLAREQLEAGSVVLDVNVGAAMVDEEAVMPRLTRELVRRFTCPLCLDSSNSDAIRSGLAAFPGSCLVNSISGETGRLEALGPLCKHYGAPFILLPLKGRNLPVTAKERLAIVEELLRRADDLGIPRHLIVVDALALTVSSKAEAAKACLETIRTCRTEWGLPTVLGLSNISFGLPARELLNATFLSMALAAGLSAHISNPNSVRLREAAAASEVLLSRDPQAETYIRDYADWVPGKERTRLSKTGAADARAGLGGSALRQAVVLGDRERVVSLIEDDLAAKRRPFAIVNEDLIPGIMAVGDKYERKEYFLPQLLLSAEAVQAGFALLKPLLESDGDAGVKEKVVMATVEGDIHDIGKNIVCLMLRNHGFEVIDLGKDVPASDIVDAALAEGARLIGLSALMTTTMVRMEDTVRMLQKRRTDIKVMVGGAVVTQAFADSIGADGYSSDAVGAVRLAKQLLGVRE